MICFQLSFSVPGNQDRELNWLGTNNVTCQDSDSATDQFHQPFSVSLNLSPTTINDQKRSYRHTGCQSSNVRGLSRLIHRGFPRVPTAGQETGDYVLRREGDPTVGLSAALLHWAHMDAPLLFSFCFSTLMRPRCRCIGTVTALHKSPLASPSTQT